MKLLNIHDSIGSAKTGWHTTVKLNDTAISNLADRNAKSSNALNAVPSPFSRLHIFETAFKLVTKDIRESKDKASKVYKELVSDCLDAIELLFNASFHESQGDTVEFINWKTSDLNSLKGGQNGQQVFGRTLSLFLEQDFKTNEYQISIIKYKGMAIAGTSPFSILFTSPNLDKIKGEFRNRHYEDAFNLINPGTGASYFKKYVPFSKRSESFKEYLADFFENHTEQKSHLRYLWDYLDLEGIRTLPGAKVKTKSISCFNGGQFEINEIALGTNADDSALDIFNDHIIKVGFKINRSFFHTPVYGLDTDDRDFDFLIPLKENFLKIFDSKEVAKYLQYDVVGVESLKVTFNHPSLSKPKVKNFGRQLLAKTDGKIVDIQKDSEYNLTLGIFPFLKVLNKDKSLSSRYNDYFKILLGVDTGKPDNLRTEDFRLSFFKVSEGQVERIPEDGTEYNYQRGVRRSFESPDPLCSIYYQVNNTSFDVIKLNLPFENAKDVGGLIIPKWREKVLGEKEFSFSVDFGTTNTFIAYTEDSSHSTVPKPFDITVDDIQMVMLHDVKAAGAGLTVTDSFQRGFNTNGILRNIINAEFVPPVLLPEDKGSPVNMPFRTAIYQKKNISTFNLFNDLNVNFGYQKHILDANAYQHQEIVANLKWDITNAEDLGSKRRVEKFIEELCYVLRYKTLLNEGNPEKAIVNWFIPQSLSRAAINSYEAIWKAKVRETLKSNVSPKTVLESEAPYYYFKHQGLIKDYDSVLSVDIGGGSTDAMLFANHIPRIGTSINFAGNVLWANGYNQFVNSARDNGFYKKLEPLLAPEVDADSILIQSKKYYQNKPTDEVINFWLANADRLSIFDNLNKGEFKIVYIFHFASIIYHLAQLLKANDFKAPKTIIFSGNGSKYVDFIGDEQMLSTICGYIFEKVFKETLAKPQVILPNQNRKEATCYGGIYKAANESFATKTYLGTLPDFKNLQDVNTYANVENSIVEIKDSVKANVLQFLKILEGLNELIPFRTDLNIPFNVHAVNNLIASKIDSYFDKGYEVRKKKISFEEKVTDSLFFYPLFGAILDLTLLDEKLLKEYIPQAVMFVTEPMEDGSFKASSMENVRSFNSIYQVSVPINNPTEATFEIIEDPAVHQRAYTSRDFVIAPVCTCINYPESPQIRIKILNKGRLIKDGDKWIVKDRLKIEFI